MKWDVEVVETIEVRKIYRVAARTREEAVEAVMEGDTLGERAARVSQVVKERELYAEPVMVRE